MQQIPYDTILEIQHKADIVDIIGEYLPLEQRGKNYFAICPFHDDHNPSMSVSPEKQIYTCFVCGASGNVFHFVMNYEKISFIEAVIMVSRKVGIPINAEINTNKKKTNIQNEKYYQMFELASKLYQNNIRTAYGKDAISYLNKRNIETDVIKEFEIGLSLEDGSLNKLLNNKKFSSDDAVLIGLCGKKDDFIYDVFRGRIMFPLWDTEGKIVGFSGRIYNDSKENKYSNSKESIIFKKGELLYNYHRAKDFAREKKQIIVVEGFMDVIRLWTIGIKNVVATMGTAITKEHANLIKRLSKNVVLSFDGDKAGEKATLSALESLEKMGLEPKIIRLEDDYDPDDYVVKKGKEAFINHLKNTLTSLDFKMLIMKNKTDFNNFDEVSNYVREVTNDLSKSSDSLVHELTIKKLSKETNLDVETIKSLIKNTPKEIITEHKRIVKSTRDKYQRGEENLVYYMLKKVEAIIIYQNNVSYLENKLLSKIAIKIMDFYDSNGYINLTDFITYLRDDMDLINEVMRLDELNLPDNVTNDELLDYVKTIDKGVLKRRIDSLDEKIKTETNVQKKIELLNELVRLKKKEWE